MLDLTFPQTSLNFFRPLRPWIVSSNHFNEKEIVPPYLKDGKIVLVMARGNSFLDLVKHLDGIDEGAIAKLNTHHLQTR